jgi:hypothetical protein
LDFGINGVVNAFSSIEGSFYDDVFSYNTVSWKSAGSRDLNTISAYVTVGWRMDLSGLRKQHLDILSKQENNNPE